MATAHDSRHMEPKPLRLPRLDNQHPQSLVRPISSLTARALSRSLAKMPFSSVKIRSLWLSNCIDKNNLIVVVMRDDPLGSRPACGGELTASEVDKPFATTEDLLKPKTSLTVSLARIEQQRPGNAQIRRGNGSDTWMHAIDNSIENN